MNEDKIDTILDHLYGELDPDKEEDFLNEVSISRSLNSRLTETRRLLTAYRLGPVMEIPPESAIIALKSFRKEERLRADQAAATAHQAAVQENLKVTEDINADNALNPPPAIQPISQPDSITVINPEPILSEENTNSQTEQPVSSTAPLKSTPKLGLITTAALIIIGIGTGIYFAIPQNKPQAEPDSTVKNMELTLNVNENQDLAKDQTSNLSDTTAIEDKRSSKEQAEKSSVKNSKQTQKQVAEILDDIDKLTQEKSEESYAPIEVADAISLENSDIAITENTVTKDSADIDVTPIQEELDEILPELDDAKDLEDSLNIQTGDQTVENYISEIEKPTSTPAQNTISRKNNSESDIEEEMRLRAEEISQQERNKSASDLKSTEPVAKAENKTENNSQTQIEKQKEAERLAQIEKQKEAEKLALIEKQNEAEKLAQIEKQNEAEKLAQIDKQNEAEKLAQIEKQNEAEKLAQIEKQKEAERLAQIEKQKEAEKLALIEKQKEAERLAQIEKQKEAERLAQIEKQKEAEKLAQIEKQKEAEKLAQIEKQKEVERLAQIEKQKEAERLTQIEKQKEAERLAQIEKQKEAERLALIEKQKEAEKLAQIETQKEAEKLAQIEKQKEAERLAQIEKQKEAERLAQIEKQKEAEKLAQIEKQKEAEKLAQIEKQKEAERLAQIEKQKEANNTAKQVKVVEPIMLKEGEELYSVAEEPVMALSENSRTPIAKEIKPGTVKTDKIEFKDSDNAAELIQKAEALYLQNSYLQALYGAEEALTRASLKEDKISALVLKARIELKLKSFNDMNTTIARLKPLSPLEASALQILCNAGLNHNRAEIRKETNAAKVERPYLKPKVESNYIVEDSPTQKQQTRRKKSKFNPTTDTYYKRK